MPTAGLCILVIEDDDAVRRTVCNMLEALGHTVSQAANGDDGIHRAHETNVDLVITDLLMPDKDGLETIIELRKTLPGLKVVAMSGGGRTQQSGFLELAQTFGADAVLEKPFSSAQLSAALERALDGPEIPDA